MYDGYGTGYSTLCIYCVIVTPVPAFIIASCFYSIFEEIRPECSNPLFLLGRSLNSCLAMSRRRLAVVGLSGGHVSGRNLIALASVLFSAAGQIGLINASEITRALEYGWPLLFNWRAERNKSAPKFGTSTANGTRKIAGQLISTMYSTSGG